VTRREKLVKGILVLAFVLIPAAPALADVGTPAEQPTQTAETIVIGAGLMAGLANAAMMASGSPSYVMGGAGVGLGLAALALTAGENPAHEKGLVAGGAFAIATGLITMRYRQVLNQREDRARVEPVWHQGAPGLALVIDF
jgi:hypothetical protein